MCVDEICSSDNSNGEIDLKSPAFQNTEYLNLIEHIEHNVDSLPDLKTIDGAVFKRTKFRTDDHNDMIWKIWVPRSLRANFLVKHHQDPIAGRGGIGKTLHRLRAKYYWPGMASDTKAYIFDCEICKSSKAPNAISRPFMGNQITSERVFQRVYIDFCGPYPRSCLGNSFVFVVLDHYSKFVFLKPMRNATASEVFIWLTPYFCRNSANICEVN